MQLFMEIPAADTPLELLLWSDDACLMDNPVDDFLAPQRDLETRSPLREYTQELGRITDPCLLLSPSLDVLSIPDELKFIMQYRKF